MQEKGILEIENEPRLKWNWGAFMMPLQFGFGNKAYLTLLTLVPLLNIVWIFVCGFKGAKWAYDSAAHKNIDAFNGSMITWNRAGLTSFVVTAVVIVLYLVLFAGQIYTLLNMF